jgi:uncharacterized protein YndB with AHSA1/START domain
MAESIRVSDVIPAPPEAVFVAWLDSDKHSAFTGSQARIAGIGGTFTAWDGYIQGTTLEADPHRRILQSWRTTEFPSESPPSLLEVLLEPDEGGTRLTLIHTEIPVGQGSQYEQGWKDHYLAPLKEYFGDTTAVPHAASPTAVVRKASPPRKAKRKTVVRAAKRKVAKRKTVIRAAKRKVAKRKTAKKKGSRKGRHR